MKRRVGARRVRHGGFAADGRGRRGSRLRVNISRSSDVAVEGRDRTDVAAGLRVTARGFDQGGQGRRERDHAEDRTRRRRPRGDLDTTAARNLPNSGISRLVVVLKVPKRLALRVEPHSDGWWPGSWRVPRSWGRAARRLTGFAGRVVLTHSGGALEIADVPRAQAQRASGQGTVTVKGQMTIGDRRRATISEIAGPLEISLPPISKSRTRISSRRCCRHRRRRVSEDLRTETPRRTQHLVDVSLGAGPSDDPQPRRGA